MKKIWGGIGVVISSLVIILGALMLSGNVFSLDLGISSFTPYSFQSGFASFGGDAYTYIANNTAAVAAHINNLYETIVKLSGIFLIVLGLGGVCLFRILGTLSEQPSDQSGVKSTPRDISEELPDL